MTRDNARKPNKRIIRLQVNQFAKLNLGLQHTEALKLPLSHCLHSLYLVHLCSTCHRLGCARVVCGGGCARVMCEVVCEVGGVDDVCVWCEGTCP